MKTHHFISIIIALSGMVSVSAQCDTVKYENPWYMHEPRPDTIDCVGVISPFLWQYCANTNGGSAVKPYATDSGVMVYGVAITMEMKWGGMQSQSWTDTNFWGVLYVNDKSNVGKYVLLDSAMCDVQAGIAGRSPKIAMFEFESDIPDSHYYCHVYEIFFGNPHFFQSGDSLFVGRYIYHLGNLWPDVKCFHYRDSMSTEYVMLQYTYETELTSNPIEFRNYSRSYLGRLGGFFPIVGLRCTVPKQWRLDSVDNAAFEWQRHDDAAGWEVQVVDRHGDIVDSMIYAADSTEQTHFALPEVLPGHDYSVRLRKLCHYATTGYDTIVRSEWTDMLTVDSDEVLHAIAVGEAPFRFSLHPNPAHGEVGVTIGGMVEKGIVAVCDMTGREVFSREVPAATESLTLNLNDLPAGAYLVSITVPSGKVSKRMIVR